MLPEPIAHEPENRPADPDLARVTAAWPNLPEPIRRAALALIGSAAPPAAERMLSRRTRGGQLVTPLLATPVGRSGGGRAGRSKEGLTVDADRIIGR